MLLEINLLYYTTPNIQIIRLFTYRQCFEEITVFCSLHDVEQTNNNKNMYTMAKTSLGLI